MGKMGSSMAPLLFAAFVALLSLNLPSTTNADYIYASPPPPPKKEYYPPRVYSPPPPKKVYYPPPVYSPPPPKKVYYPPPVYSPPPPKKVYYPPPLGKSFETHRLHLADPTDKNGDDEFEYPPLSSKLFLIPRYPWKKHYFPKLSPPPF